MHKNTKTIYGTSGVHGNSFMKVPYKEFPLKCVPAPKAWENKVFKDDRWVFCMISNGFWSKN